MMMGVYRSAGIRGSLAAGALLFCLLASCLTGCGEKGKTQETPTGTVAGVEGANAPTLAGDDTSAGNAWKTESSQPNGQNSQTGNPQSKEQGTVVGGDSQSNGQGSQAEGLQPNEQGASTEDSISQPNGQASQAEDSQPSAQNPATGIPSQASGTANPTDSDTTNPQPTESTEDFVIVGDVLLRYNGSEKTVIVPDGVQSIGIKAFYGNLSVVNIHLPEGINEICEGAFANCRHLEEVHLPESLKTVGNRAFFNCPALENIDLQHVEELGSYAFQKCYKLTDVYLTNLKRLGASVFYEAGVETVTGMDFLEEVNGGAFTETPFWQKYKEKSGQELFICNQILLFGRVCGDELEIPQGVRIIDSGAFTEEYGLRRVIIPDSMEAIRSYAFDECGLETIDMPKKNIQIGENAFGRDLWGLEIRLFSDGKPQETNPDFLVAGATLLAYRGKDVDVVVPDYVKVIGEEAFGSGQDILSVSLPEGVTKIEADAFSFCNALKKVSLPSSLTSIGYGAFESCSALKEINLQYVQEIDEEAFYGCGQLSAVELLSVRTIGAQAFAGSGVSRVDGMEQLSDSGDGIFFDTPLFGENDMCIAGSILFDGTRCKGDVVIPKGVEVIAQGAFRKAGITSVTCPDTLREIRAGAFRGCADLREFFMEDSVVFLGDMAFCENGNLSDVRLSAKLAKIPERAFEGCRQLQMLTIPEGCEVEGLLFQPEGWSGERKVRLLTIPPTKEVSRFLQDSLMQDCKIYTSELPEDPEWAADAQIFGWSLFLLELTETERTLREGEQYQLIFNSGAKADWYSEDETVVSVDRNGRLTAGRAGQTDVVAIIYGKEYRCRVTVVK